MARAMNFNAGPAALPLAALERAQRELLDFGGTGMSIIEHSHRGKAYEAVHNEAIALLRELLAIPDTHQVLFLQGGASQQFAVIPMNLLPQGKSADYIVTGAWGKKAFQEAKTVGTVRIAGGRRRGEAGARAEAVGALARRERRVRAPDEQRDDRRQPVPRVPGHRQGARSSPTCRATFCGSRSTCRSSGSSTPARRRTSVRAA